MHKQEHESKINYWFIFLQNLQTDKPDCPSRAGGIKRILGNSAAVQPTVTRCIHSIHMAAIKTILCRRDDEGVFEETDEGIAVCHQPMEDRFSGGHSRRRLTGPTVV